MDVGCSCVVLVYIRKLYKTQASELNILALLHDYSFFIIKI